MFKETRAADLPLAQPLPPLTAHDSMRNHDGTCVKAADVDKRSNIRQGETQQAEGKLSTEPLHLGTPL